MFRFAFVACADEKDAASFVFSLPELVRLLDERPRGLRLVHGPAFGEPDNVTVSRAGVANVIIDDLLDPGEPRVLVGKRNLWVPALRLSRTWYEYSPHVAERLPLIDAALDLHEDLLFPDCPLAFGDRRGINSHNYDKYLPLTPGRAAYVTHSPLYQMQTEYDDRVTAESYALGVWVQYVCQKFLWNPENASQPGQRP